MQDFDEDLDDDGHDFGIYKVYEVPESYGVTQCALCTDVQGENMSCENFLYISHSPGSVSAILLISCFNILLTVQMPLHTESRLDLQNNEGPGLINKRGNNYGVLLMTDIIKCDRDETYFKCEHDKHFMLRTNILDVITKDHFNQIK